jgi:hypothetical protein
MKSATTVILLMSGLYFSPFMLSGQDHFQQRVDHIIRVELDDERHMLHGHQRFTYTNNSPGALDTIWIHLWPNAYSGRNTALSRQLVDQGNLALHFADAGQRGKIDSLDFRVEQTALRWGYHHRHPDIGWIKLPEPLNSGNWITIHTPFRVKIPDSRFSRLGHTGQAYHITQWFPKPAVHDRDGWHAMPYLTQGEFYSNFGTYDVTITLPRNYVVAATGMLKDNPEEEQFLDNMARGAIASYPSDVFPTSDTETKTLRYVQDNVHDFAWFADKRFIVKKGSVTLPRSGRTVTTWTMYTPRNAALWSDAIEYVNESVRLYSEWVGDYPYDACTAVDGTISAGGGMEYPMVTIIGNMSSKEALDNVIAHEVGHNWFYGILASNERQHPWLDEGMNSFVELRYMRQRHGGKGAMIQVPFLKMEEIKDGRRFESEAMYLFNARRNLDQPVQCHSACFTPLNYGAMVYGKSALIFDHLFAYLGEEVFDRCMHAYFEEWKFRHPRPQDVRVVFERESGKDLSWVFDELLTTDHKVDFKARGLRGDEFQYRNTGETTIPFPVSGFKDTLLLGTTWIEGPTGRGTATLPWTDADRVNIDHDQRTVDIDRRNNQASRGLFNSPLPRLRFLTGIEHPRRRTLYWTPLVARNGHDGWHLGLGLHNYHFPSQRTEWIVAPMYAFGSERWIGGARIEHHFDRMRSWIFQNIGIGINARTASTLNTENHHIRYSKIAPGMEFLMKRDPLSRPWEHRIGLRAVYLRHEATFTPSEGGRSGFFREDLYGEISHTAVNRSALAPTMVRPVLQAREGFLRGSLEVTQGFTYNRRKDQVRLRAFAGTFFMKPDPLRRLEVWRLSWGPEDMLFDHVYLERGAQDGFRGRQFVKQQGAFRTPFRGGASDSWTGAVNMEADLPIPLPISLFGSWGIVPMTTRTAEGITSGTATYYEAGVGLQLMKDVIEVWFPLLVSDRIRDEENFLGTNIVDRIRFVVAFEQLDPTRLLRRARP